MFQGKAFELVSLGDGLVELIFDLQGESVNKFNMAAMSELTNVLDILESTENIQGLVFTSAKDVFVVGADINEFGAVFAAGEDAIKAHLESNNHSFCRIEDLAFPTVVAINGYALGGGTEVCLACDYRIAAHEAKLGLPETKLGIIPGWGGTVRLPRLAGVDVAVDWIASGKDQKASKAFSDGVLDGVVEQSVLRDSAINLLQQVVEGDFDYQARREQKTSALKLNDMESLLAFESSKAFVKGQAGRNYPAPVAAIQAMQTAAKYVRADALNVERDAFAELAKGSVAQSLVGLFLGDQALVKKAKTMAKAASRKVEQAAVLGAGIMGGGIAYQSASKGVPIVMKDVSPDGLRLGMDEASKILAKRVDRGRISTLDMAKILSRITPTLGYEAVKQADIVVEAVVENASVKKAVLAEVEQGIGQEAVLCSNTSTISITDLATSLERPQNFCGMHFFNPVHAMPLVEVIRGESSSDAAVAQTVAYALALGKKPVVVRDCPGFLVNRVLFPYFAGFAALLRDGADFQQVDKVMERWGWPMGPAYLMDVVGIDTGVHAENVMAAGFPDRMQRDYKSAGDILFEAKRFGQKTDLGFYAYKPDKKGKPQKVAADDTYDLLAKHCAARKEFDDQDIIERMMIPMVTELMRCIDEGIVDSAWEADMALIYGLGFPPFRGGVFRWLDAIGMQSFGDMLSKHAALGPLYQSTDEMRDRIASHHVFYPISKGHKEADHDA